MAIFQNNPDQWQRLDYSILQNGWISLYWQRDVLDNDISWFEKEKFKIIDLDCTKWLDTKTIHKDLKKYFDFPDYYGENLAALNDCLSDLEINDQGFIVVFRNFQSVDKDLTHKLLDIFANNSRQHILFGEKLLTLVQVDDPNYQIEPVGSCPVLWNGAEWLNSKRGL
jgi:RNAse (barnase) inhibitor barstar